MNTEEQIAELLKPRYKVIGDFPFMNKEVKIYGESFAIHNRIFHSKDYPAILQPLPWYAERKPEEMPEYVKFVKNYIDFKKGQVFKTTPELKSDHTKDFIYFLLDGSRPKKFIDNKVGMPGGFNQLQPATESEYNQYINSKK